MSKRHATTERWHMQEGINEMHKIMYNDDIGQSILETTYK
jgi:hypothetical protein